MTSHHYDCIIVGAGMVGLLLAKALRVNGFKVAIIERKTPQLKWSSNEPAARVSALHQASINILTNLGALDVGIKNNLSSLRGLKVYDAAASGVLEFNATDVGVSQMGCIVENRVIVASLWQQLQSDHDVDWYLDTCLQDIVLTDQMARVVCSDGNKLTAQLLVGADGAHSQVRQLAGFKLCQRAYQHHALVATIGVAKSHRQHAWQNFMSDGVLGVLPLTDPHQCSIVWSVRPERAQYLMQLESKSFNCELTNGLGCMLGDMSVLSQRRCIELVRRQAIDCVKPRVMLIGDAAHTIHPLAGQGANLGFMDVAACVQVLKDAQQCNKDIGSWLQLRRYERWRKADVYAMQFLMQLTHDLYAETGVVASSARAQGMVALQKIKIIKQYMIKYAMGERLDAPDLALVQ